MSRLSRAGWAMQLAQITAKRSTCCRRHVGCVLLNAEGHVLSTGYNGVASGLPHCNEEATRLVGPDVPTSRIETYYPNACLGALSPSGTNLDGCQAIHAEQNALLQCRDVREIFAAYVTASPCMTCTKLLLNTRCKQIVFLEEYPQPEASKLWLSAGRTWVKSTS